MKVKVINMEYKYEHRPPTPNGEGVTTVADVYVVHSDSERIVPSGEFLAAVRTLSEPAQAIIRRLVDVGFQDVVRK